jgi:dolichol kinase
MDALEVKRQVLHGSGVFIALFLLIIYDFFGGWMAPAIILVTIISIAYGISFLHRRGAKIPLLTKMITDAERSKDKEFPGRGALRFFTGVLLTLLIFRNSPVVVAAGVIVLALGDSASTLGGLAFGRHKIFYNKDKSIEGSLAGFIASFIGLKFLLPLNIIVAAISSFTGLFVESLPLGIDDNLTVPVAAGIAAWVLTKGVII